MNVKGRKAKNQATINNSIMNVLSQEELTRRIALVESEMKAFTWRQLETRGKFSKDDKLSFINDDMLIIGCDIGSDSHYVRAIDTRGRELSKGAFTFSNDNEGFRNAKEWALKLAAEHNKAQIVLGLEPTGHYWFCLAAWMISNGISVVQVNPYAVKQTKELEDNSQSKNDRKDPKLIANLVKDGNFGMPYLPEDLYADLRRLSMLRDQLTEDRVRSAMRNCGLTFPTQRIVVNLAPADVKKVGSLYDLPILIAILKAGHQLDGLRKIWHDAKLRGRGYNRADKIIRLCEESVGLKHGTSGGKESARWFAEQMMELSEKLVEIETMLREKCRKIPHVENVLTIKGIGDTTLSGILAEMGDNTRFDDVKEIQKLSGLGLVACSSGKHKGETKISHRGRKRLRYWLFIAAKSVITHSEEFRSLHEYYTTRLDNPLKKMQSVIAIACKLLRIIYTLLRTGRKYDPEKMLRDIRRPTSTAVQTA